MGDRARNCRTTNFSFLIVTDPLGNDPRLVKMKLAVVFLTLVVYGAAKTNAYSLTEGLKSMENENVLTSGLAQTEMNGVAAIKRAFEEVMEDMFEDDQDMKIA